jgi:hypothetical protein
MRGNSNSLWVVVALAMALALVLSGCSPTGPQWVDSGGTYTTKTVSNVYAKADIAKYAEVSAADTTKLRHDALTGLRKQGAAASDAADLLTRTLPADSRGVPVYVEKASFDGKPSVILVEAIGPAKGKLTTKRLWVLSASGAVLFVGTR